MVRSSFVIIPTKKNPVQLQYGIGHAKDARVDAARGPSVDSPFRRCIGRASAEAAPPRSFDASSTVLCRGAAREGHERPMRVQGQPWPLHYRGFRVRQLSDLVWAVYPLRWVVRPCWRRSASSSGGQRLAFGPGQRLVCHIPSVCHLWLLRVTIPILPSSKRSRVRQATIGARGRQPVGARRPPAHAPSADAAWT